MTSIKIDLGIFRIGEPLPPSNFSCNDNIFLATELLVTNADPLTPKTRPSHDALGVALKI